MDSSSEDSFTWVTTSRDSSESDSMDETDAVQGQIEPDRKKKKSKQKSSENCNKFEDERGTKPNVKIKKEQFVEESYNRKKKLAKIESESENEVPKKKRKLKDSKVEKDHNEPEDSYDESYLDLKVKQENICLSTARKTKTKSLNDNGTKSSVNSDSYDENYLDLKVDKKTIFSSPVHKSKKKKKNLDCNGSKISETFDRTFNNSDISEENLNHDVPKEKRKLKDSQVEKNHNEPEDSYDENYLDSKVKQENICPSTAHKTKTKSLNDNDTKSSVNSDSYDESYLDLKVDKETIFSSPVHKSKKKKKNLDSNGSKASETFDKTFNNSDIPEENLNHDYDVSDNAKSKKKRKKGKKERDRVELDNEMDIDDKISVSSCDKNTSDAIVRSNTSLTENDTFPDETICGEISAIQGDEDHKLHSILLDDSKARTNKKKNVSLHKSTILKQFKEDEESQKILQKGQEETKRPRISDRIMFEEDDEDSDLNTNIENEMSSKLKKYLKANNDLKVVSLESTQNSIFTSDDEVWTVKCPKGVDVMSLSGTNLNINDKCKVKISGQTYDGRIDEEHTGTTTVLSMKNNKYELMNLPLRGTIKLRRRIPKAHFYEDNVMVNNQTNFIPLPEVKCRHPLFGYDYKKKIKIPSTIQARLHPENGEESAITVEKRKKKKHKKDKNMPEHEETGASDDVRFPKSEVDRSLDTTGKKRKKQKHLEDVSPAPKRVKKIKHDPECAETWESEKAIEQNLFDF